MWDIYNGVSEAIEQHKPQLIRLLEEHIDFDKLIPVNFKLAFYRHMGRKHKYHLESYIRAFVVQKLLGIPKDTLLLFHCCDRSPQHPHPAGIGNDAGFIHGKFHDIVPLRQGTRMSSAGMTISLLQPVIFSASAWMFQRTGTPA